MNRFRKFGWLFLFAVFLIAVQALTVQPQLSPDEQSVIVNAVVQTINPEVLAASIAQTVEAKVMANLGAAPVATMTMTPEPAAVNGTAPSVTPESYVGLHAKFVNSYA